MEFSIKSGSPEKQRGACVVVGVFEPRKLTLPAELIDNAARNYLSEVLRRGDMDGKAGSTLLLHDVPSTLCDRVLLVGLGKEKEFREKEYCAAIRATIKALNETGAFDATLFLTEIAVRKRSVDWRIRQAVVVAREASYRFENFKSKKNAARRSLRKITFAIERRNELAVAEEALTQGLAIAAGSALARDLGNTPGNVCTPSYLAQAAVDIAQEHGLECQVLERGDMEALGMHSLLSVAKGSHQPPKLAVVHYKGGKADEKPVVLVGKGITFDTGGISLKPGAEMDEMKFDMCGAASVLGTLKAVAQMKLPINLSVIVPASENMPGGGASKPGDIVTSMSGQTVEILNTDAEGPPDPLRRADLRRALRTRHGDRRRDADRRLRDRPRPRRDRPLLEQRRFRARTAARRRGSRRPRLADAALGGIPGPPEEQLRRHGQHRRPRRRQHFGGLFPVALHQELQVGAPRHRRNGLEVGQRKRRDRPPRAAPHPLPAQTRRQAQLTQIFFYHNAADRIAAAAALIGRAYAAGKPLLVYAPRREAADALDRVLWQHPPGSFVPHVRIDSPLAAQTPILIAGDLPEELPQSERLMNLGDSIPPGFSRFSSVVEVVGQDAEERLAGRERVKFYKDRGYAVSFIDCAENA